MTGLSTSAIQRRIDQQCKQPSGEIAVSDSQATKPAAATDAGRNPIYEGQFDGETPEQAAHRLHWAKAGLAMGRDVAADQHARDSAELRRLSAERDQLRAEFAALKAQPSGVDERVPELSSFVAFADALGLDLRQSDDQWNSALALYEKLIAAYPQPSAALSAPSHGEQVRDGWAVSLMGPDEVVRIQRKDGKWCGVTHLSESPRDRLLYEFLRTIAAPSAGSQGGDV